MAKIAYSTLACPDWSWETVVLNGAAYGYDGVEVRQIAGETDLLKVPQFQSTRLATSREFLNRAHFAVCGLASSVRFDYPEHSQREQQLHIGRAYVELAAALGAGFIRVFGDILPDASKPGERAAVLVNIADGLNRLGEFAANHQVDILLETHGDFSDSALVAQLFRSVESPRVGLVWDTHHPWRFFHEAPEATFEILKPWIRHTHWKDSVLLPEGEVPAGSAEANTAAQAAHALMSGHRHADYVLFAGGEFPIERFVQLLKQAGYDGWLSLEWEKMWHPRLASPEVALPLFPPKMRSFWSRSST